VQVLDIVIGFEIGWSLVDLVQLIITGILIDQFDVLLLPREIGCMVPVGESVGD
jgi:hypothetical protein